MLGPLVQMDRPHIGIVTLSDHPVEAKTLEGRSLLLAPRTIHVNLTQEQADAWVAEGLARYASENDRRIFTGLKHSGTSTT